MDVLSAAGVLRRFDAEMRERPPFEPGHTIERADGIVVRRGRTNFVLYARLEPETAHAAIDRCVAGFAASGEELEWKSYAHDAQPWLGDALAKRGFEREEPETLMALDIRDASTTDVAIPGVDILRVETSADIATYCSVTARAFERPADVDVEAFAARLFGAGADTIAFIATVGRDAAAVGRLELPPERSFASAWGGGTLATHRGRGLYRALVAARARIARERGYAFLTVDARETSRPILERLGFAALTTIDAWTLPARPS